MWIWDSSSYVDERMNMWWQICVASEDKKEKIPFISEQNDEWKYKTEAQVNKIPKTCQYKKKRRVYERKLNYINDFHSENSDM